MTEMLATPANMQKLALDAGDPIAAPGLFAYSPRTGERYSASAGDYFWQPLNEPLCDSEGEPMVLASAHTSIAIVDDNA